MQKFLTDRRRIGNAAPTLAHETHRAGYRDKDIAAMVQPMRRGRPKPRAVPGATPQPWPRLADLRAKCRFSGLGGRFAVPLRPLEIRALFALLSRLPDAAFGLRLPPRVSHSVATVAPAIYFLPEEFLLTKLYVGNLPFSATEDSVRQLFAAHGNVEKVALVNDRDTGQPRGFGFVEMSSADAQSAMQALNGKDFGGRPLKVNEAQDKPRGGGGGGGYGRR
jgi:hypothetical protein